MTTPSTSMSTNQLYLQTELFRPSLTYPVHLYDEMLTRTAERYPEHVAIVSKEVNLTYRELEALVRFTSLETMRSEEHTSELQSHLNLVCRLLLEKKKKNRNTTYM